MVSRWGLSLLLVCAGPSVLAQEALHRWVDESGRVHYSDQIPPERVNQPHQVLDKQGRRVQDVGAAKTPEERAAEEAARKVRLEREAQEKAERELQAREDQRLLMVYNSEEALVRARQARLESFDRLYDLEKDDYARILKDLRELEKAGSAKED
ncbi:MAG: DUF4124 domain-containing protein, partial [Halothiobacillaceae bacterium]|nr:DUF4124 domain-containing protein [Halothiobacillaceae bacterium]